MNKLDLLFLNNFPNKKLDQGRIIFPSSWKINIGDEILLIKRDDRPFPYIYGVPLEISEKVVDMPLEEYVAHSCIEVVKKDNANKRLLLPKDFRESIGIYDRYYFYSLVGKGSYFEVHNIGDK